ncbi:LAFA_0G11210g1_1 [Lachancea sp. 'fantastica']|nr:LAFA_0G11210g1_1 [Lachancea sp. 'fantastica']
MSKILVLRANVQTVTEVLTKAEALNTKSGPFDCAIILGHIFESIQDAPCPQLPVFFTNGSNLLVEKHGTSSMNHNLTLLNGYGVLQTTNDLRIAYLSGDKDYLLKNQEEIRTLFKNAAAKDVDILITDGWSRGHYLSKDESLGEDTLEDEAVKLLKPKYHFATLAKNKFQEASPFKWGDSEKTTRCLNLAEYNSGAKWAYAFSVDSTSARNDSATKSFAANPYEKSTSSKREFESEGTSDYALTKKPKQILPQDCRFCLSNPTVQDHLIIHISDHAYLTIAKGPLTVPTAQMNFSGHCLLIAIKHIPKLKPQEDLQSDVFETPLFKEIERYEASVSAMNYEKFSMSTVAFEINSQRSIHYHIQLFPIPSYLIAKFESALDRQVHFNNTKYDHNAKLKFQTFTDLNDLDYKSIVNDSNNNYIQFTIFEKGPESSKTFVATFKPEERIDLQFGRRVLAFVLNLPKRAKWDSPACHQSIEEEDSEVKAFQTHFKSFEP